MIIQLEHQIIILTTSLDPEWVNNAKRIPNRTPGPLVSYKYQLQLESQRIQVNTHEGEWTGSWLVGG